MIDIGGVGVGHRPSRAREQGEQPPQVAQHHHSIRAGIGKHSVLNEGTIGIEAITRSNKGKEAMSTTATHIAERITPLGDLG